MKEGGYSGPRIVRFCLYEIIKKKFIKHLPGLFSVFFLSESEELVLHIGLVIYFIFVPIKIIFVYSTRSNSSAFVMF